MKSQRQSRRLSLWDNTRDKQRQERRPVMGPEPDQNQNQTRTRSSSTHCLSLEPITEISFVTAVDARGPQIRFSNGVEELAPLAFGSQR
jgi:hypothetical protein